MLLFSLLLAILSDTPALAQNGLVNRGSFLTSGNKLKIGEALVSPSGEFAVVTKTDGNLCVLRDSDHTGVWCSRSTSAGEAVYVTGMQTDGNLCTATEDARPHIAWCLTDQPRYDGPFFLAMQDDANLCIYNGTPGHITGTVWCSMALATPRLPRLVYGHAYHLKNGFDHWSGGYLDTRNPGCERNALCVSTANTDERDQGSGSWLLKSAQGKADGTPVMPGDKIFLKNLYPWGDDPSGGKFGGYLDTRQPGCEGNKLCVSTSMKANSNTNTSVWTVETDRFNTYIGQALRLRNGWDGSYLDTRNPGCEGNLLCVSTSASANRDRNSGDWRFETSLAAYAARYAPRLRFDTAAKGYPMSAQPYFEQRVQRQPAGTVQNTDPNTLGSGTIPTYYQAIKVGEQIRIKYWWFYGYQSACDGVSGSHHADWENVTVILAEDRNSIAAVVFEMHGDFYTRLAARNAFAIEEGTHPVVYVGKASHASFYNQGGIGDVCLPWEEWRNNHSGTHLDSWTRLLNLDDNGEAWMAIDRTVDFEWGGISTHPTRLGPSASMKATKWSFFNDTRRHSNCKLGDTQYNDHCMKSWWSSYNFDYEIPTTDRGLLVNED
ncbi:hypothetical protein C9I28_22850 [Pseudoduganella armeniaca]|uniref:Bulb-type lectin domain-containing protein n=1 Tax=Pseudoduganella armeniaca TaxID=2072590 RepID=A0A2R4CFA2_9BURK|nr:hypothetical protein C9I28_22850 [Pseudoduganella armeniaca]